MVTDEELSRFIDSELADDEMTAVSTAVAADAGLAARLERLRAADRLFAGAISKINDHPLPPAATALLTATAPVRADEKRRISPAFARWRIPTAIAASFAIGLIGAAMVLPSALGDSASLAAGPVAPKSRLADALGSTASGASVRAGVALVTPILSFRTSDGLLCREFRWESRAAGAHGVACRNNGQWTVRVAASEPRAEGYRLASSSAAVDAFVDSVIAGDPLSPDDERAVLTSAQR